MKSFIVLHRKNIVNGIFILLLLILIFNPNAKTFFLKQLMSIGLMKAEIQTNVSIRYPGNVSFNFINSNGKIISTDKLKGRVLFVNFWASWCPPCRAEMSSLGSLYDKLKNDSGFVFLFINEDEDKVKAENFLTKYRYTFPIIVSSGNVPEAVFSHTLPTTVIIGRDGKIVFRHEGMAGYDTESFIKQLKALRYQ